MREGYERKRKRFIFILFLKKIRDTRTTFEVLDVFLCSLVSLCLIMTF